MKDAHAHVVTGRGESPKQRRAAAGSKVGSARASLHSKAAIIDQRLAVIGSMNLDLRSQRQNSEVALVIRSAAVARDATRQVEATAPQQPLRRDHEHHRGPGPDHRRQRHR